MSRTLNPTRWTLALSAGLALAAIWMTLLAGHDPILDVRLPGAPLAAGLAAVFMLGELFLMNVEFRRQAHSLTLAGVPLILGVLLASPETLVLARLAGSLVAFGYQRISAKKTIYNGSAYAFEAALDITLLHLLFATGAGLDARTGLIVVGVVAAVDQLMCAFVLLVIRLHNGPLSRRDAVEVLAPALTLSVIASAFGFAALLLMQRGLFGTGVIAVLAAVGVFAYQGHAATRRRHQALTLVHEFVAGGVGAESLESLGDQLLSRIRRLLRASIVELVLLDSHAAETRAADAGARSGITLTSGEDDRLIITHSEFDPADWVLVRALAHDEPLLAARTTKDRSLRRWLDDRGARDAIMAPLPESSGLAGTLTVSDRLGETSTFDEDDLTLLQTLAGHLAVAVRGTRLVEKLGFDATHDSLTGLSNRAYLSEQIAAVLAETAPSAAVLLLDLDRFKEVNDILGHAVGDRLLTVLGGRLRDCVPPTATVARLGGDEFAILVPRLAGLPGTVLELAEHVAESLAQPIQFEEAMLTPETSIGVSVTTPDNPQTELLRQADTAMYEAKSNDKRVAVYCPTMDSGRIERLALLADLRAALSTHPEQFVLQYQPKIDLKSEVVTSVEALVRWHHPMLGVIAPDGFIPLAEAAGLIGELTHLVLRAALAECARWSADGIDISVAVNLSARNISDPGLPKRVAAALEQAGVGAEQLILEITESSVMGDPEQTVPVLHELHDLGLSLSLDDFGTGYSSLSYLQRLPVDEVKIDRSFILGLSGDSQASSRALIRSIAGLGATLGLRIVAEGIEDRAALDTLRELGCDTGQGYYISRPLAAAEFRTWLVAETPGGYPQLRLLAAN